MNNLPPFTSLAIDGNLKITKYIQAFLLILLCALLAGMGSAYADGSEKLNGCYGAEKFGNGNVRIEFQFPNCAVAQKFRILLIQSEYIKSCYIPNYKKILGMSFNESEVAQLRLGISYPGMTPAEFSQQENNNIISVNLSAKSCDGRDDFNPDDLIKKVVLKKSAEGKPLYGEEEILPFGVKYKALTESRYHKADIYILKLPEHNNITVRCEKKSCMVDGYSFLSGYYLSFTFDEFHLPEVLNLKKDVEQFMEQKFNPNY